MAYPDHLLADGETVARRLHPHWITLVAPILIFVVVVGVGSYVAAIVPDNVAQTGLRLSILGVGVVVLIWLVLRPLLIWRTTHYVVTTNRVMIRTGVLKHVGRDIPLSRINDVSFEQGLFDRIIGSGTLVIESAGEHGQETLANVPDADDVQQLINRVAEEHETHRRHGDGYGYPPGQAYPEDPYGSTEPIPPN